jgi:hypothetical protein
MRIVDNLYELYKDLLVGDEEDAEIIVSSILSEMEREHYLEWIGEMSEVDLYQMLGNFLVYKLRVKMAEEGLGHHDGDVPPHDGTLH